MNVQQSLLIILLSPLVAATLIALFARKHGKLAIGISVLSSAIQVAFTLKLLYGAWDGTALSFTETWLQLGSLKIDLGFYLNQAAASLLFVVSFVGFLIHIFAIGYSNDDPNRGRFFGGLSIFMFSMTGIVLAESLFMLFIFWELVGFSSYMLIGHYLYKDSAAAASRKAFIVNRVGDFGFLLGILMVFWTFGTTSLPALQELVAHDSSQLFTLMGICLFSGVLGKSAQFPLHVWLPDAMEGPTPVSALIHAATMVAAGVYLLGRVVFLFTPEALDLVMIVGAITALYAAICAFGVTDIKKILAYSTLSQLGYMVTAFALGTAYDAAHVADAHGAALHGVGTAQFHLTTHAFFKALMFLGAGSIIHSCHHEQDIYKMGGLWKKMPVTFLTFSFGFLAIAGIPGLSGYTSKHSILQLAQAYEGTQCFFWLLSFTALLTACYMGRLYFVTFFGKTRSEAAEHSHESSLVMLLPLVVLAVLSVIGGMTQFFPESLKAFFEGNVFHAHGNDESLLSSVSYIATFGGIALAFLLYYLPLKNLGDDTIRSKMPLVFNFLKGKLWIDELYNFYVRVVQQRFADILHLLEQIFISGLLVRGSGAIAGLTGQVVRLAHTGSIHGYVYWFLIGVAVFWAFAVGIL